MILKCDIEAESVIKQLCDIGLKAGGLANLQPILALMRSISVLPPLVGGETPPTNEDDPIKYIIKE
jgi:hypothetical protein